MAVTKTIAVLVLGTLVVPFLGTPDQAQSDVFKRKRLGGDTIGIVVESELEAVLSGQKEINEDRTNFIESDGATCYFASPQIDADQVTNAEINIVQVDTTNICINY